MQVTRSKHLGGDTGSPGADLSSDSSSRSFDLLAPIAGMALPQTRERGVLSGCEAEDRIRTKAEILGQMYSLTGAGS